MTTRTTNPFKVHKVYPTLYERLVANTREPDGPNGCWEWTGARRGHYGSMAVRVPGKKHPMQRTVSRIMLEEIHQIDFPHDEAGHLCYNTLCINPDHTEVETRVFNLSSRRGYAGSSGCPIPTLYPRRDRLDEAACAAWDSPGIPSDTCPF